MAMLTLQNASVPEVTLLSNTFIDFYMPEANGEFVKVYIYLLRSLSQTPVSFSLAQMADRLLCTERDILRALKYWAKQGLLSLDFTDNKKLCGIALLAPAAPSRTQEAPSSTPEQPADGDNISSPQPLTPERVSQLKQNEDIVQLLYIAEQYLGKTLTPTETRKILFFYDELHMSVDLIDYLIEYCVGRDHRSIRYIETVAMAWKEEGITTVEMAKDSASRYSKEYFSVLKAMGITNRNPSDVEISLINTWTKDYGFTMDLIQEACSRTVLQTGQPSFPYADKILQRWKDKSIRTLEDVRVQDAQHQKRKLEKAAANPTQPKASASNRFNNFHQRDYDFAEYEKKLLNKPN